MSIRDLSQETKIVEDKISASVTASTDITGGIVDLFAKDDILVHVNSGLTAGTISLKIQTSSTADFSDDVIEVTDEAVKANTLEGIKLSKDQKVVDFGLSKQILKGRYLRITYKPDASAVTSGLTSFYVLETAYSHEN